MLRLVGAHCCRRRQSSCNMIGFARIGTSRHSSTDKKCNNPSIVNWHYTQQQQQQQIRRSYASSSMNDGEFVRIGKRVRPLGKFPPDAPHLVPCGYLPASAPSAADLDHLQWLMSKDSLGQDMLLIGPPGAGSLHRRRLALMYAELTRREVEVVTLSADITESDLKQRRELTNDKSSSSSSALQVEFVDQAPVRAAIHGRLLLLDGLEKTERNVLPTLNNLLENREMQLEDGRLLVSPERYQSLVNDENESSSFLVSTHPDFRVIALGVPVPPYKTGRSLDPPLRSRFQIRRIDNPSAEDIYEELLQSGDTAESIAKSLATFAASLEASAADFSMEESKRPLHFPINHLPSMAQQLATTPTNNLKDILLTGYPIAVDDARIQVKSNPRQQESAKMFQQLLPPKKSKTKSKSSDPRRKNNNNTTLVRKNIVPTAATEMVLQAMKDETAVDQDILLLSPKGEGKSSMVHLFASDMGYKVNLFGLYKDMTSRDLLLRRTTDSTSGETIWEDSPLLHAARHGHLCILDGVEKLNTDTLTSLASLVHDRELSLPDGRRLLSSHRCQSLQQRYGKKEEPFMIHPSFRIVALGTTSSKAKGLNWLTEDVMSMFKTLVLPSPTKDSLKQILQSANPAHCPEIILDQLLQFRESLEGNLSSSVQDYGMEPLSLRSMLRVVRLVNDDTKNSFDLHKAIRTVMVASLWLPTQRDSLNELLREAGIQEDRMKADDKMKSIQVQENSIQIGDFTMDRLQVQRPEMVPSPIFFDIPSHINAIQSLLQEWKVGERSFLLLGNQGVGKNKVVDRICEIVNFEREYIQLHRDSTIGQLTLSPSLEDGKIVWKDSPLVRAVQRGCSLVIDEADKAPIEVISILKGLVEDGEVLLADGRRISRHERGDGIIEIHPDFTLWVLANRPGFPFHGNDFFQEVGDCFSTMVLPNPDLQSEIGLLRSYAPTVDDVLLNKIAASFAELRELSDQGEITYPYSTREAVSVVKHLEMFPDDGIVSTIHNVLDMDSFDSRLYSQIGEVFRKHDIQMADYPTWQKMLRAERASKKDTEDLRIEYIGGTGPEGKSHSPPQLSAPKFGKWDEANEAHVGGNQWAGGTGGSDTAGLGGRGGPYRLDRGHKVHQVSDEAKAEVSAEAAAAARDIKEKAFRERLDEIGMSESMWELYDKFVGPIRKDIASLRGTLNSVELKNSERSWISRQSHGELDESRIVDGVTGEKYIYRRRGIVPPDAGNPIQQPKRLRFVLDCSGSMYRFNGYDERLNRCLEAAALIMESFAGMESRFDYSIVGHSGESRRIPFVNFGQPPTSENERMKMLQTMVAHSQFCESGDNTVPAIAQAIVDVSEGVSNDEGNDFIVIGVSDANLNRYGIHPRELGNVMEKTDKVKSYCIFIASFGQEAEEIKRSLPRGRGFVCMQTSDLPRVMREILSANIDQH